ncbi:hypothetical protein LMORI2_02800 [Limnohabitans sp. MORI2]|nr:hypothetical protein LMORI2_02800 [Limnohabitans sp. MORI2]
MIAIAAERKIAYVFFSASVNNLGDVAPCMIEFWDDRSLPLTVLGSVEVCSVSLDLLDLRREVILSVMSYFGLGVRGWQFK